MRFPSTAFCVRQLRWERVVMGEVLGMWLRERNKDVTLSSILNHIAKMGT